MSEENGTLLQGADGSVFFIPADRLAEFRVADENAVGVKEALDQLEPEVGGFAFVQNEARESAYAPRGLKDGVFQMKAFSGPIGIRTPKPGIKEGDGIYGG